MDIRKNELQEAFQAAGKVLKVTVQDHYALVAYADARGAKKAIRSFHGGKLNDRRITVEYEHEVQEVPSRSPLRLEKVAKLEKREKVDRKSKKEQKPRDGRQERSPS